MKDRVEQLIASRPEHQFASAVQKVESLFGNTDSFSVGMGLGRKLGDKQPAFMSCGNRFGSSAFRKQRQGA